MEKFRDTNFDIIVVGSGPGGATVARELSRRNKKVIILEWGNRHKITGGLLPPLKMLLPPGRGVLFTNRMLAILRCITTGGSSLLYFATAFPPPVEILNKYGLDISKELEEIENELPHSPLPDNLVGPMGRRIMESAVSLGYKWEKLPKFIYPEKCKVNCNMCSLGCPYQAKWNASMYIDEAVNNGAVLLNQAKVERAIIDNKKAVGVEFRMNGRKFKVFAPITVIAAGGIGSPMILRESGIKNVGNDFFIDPLLSICGTVNDIKGGKEIPMVAGMNLSTEGIVMTDMTLPASVYKGFAAQVFRYDRMFAHSHTLQIMVKIRDELGGVMTKRGGVRKKLSENDYNKLMKGYDIGKGILKNAGAKNIFKTWYLAAHPGGTVKIGDVVNSELRTECKNLYVCDSSVIPEAWGLPPTLTLLALGKRLSKHIVGDSLKEVKVKNKIKKKKRKKSRR